MDSTGTSSGHARRRGRPPKLTPEEIEALVGLVRENPLLSLDDTVESFRQERRVTLSTPTVRKYLLAAGFHFHCRRPGRAVRATESRDYGAAVEARPLHKKYGYNEAHRETREVSQAADVGRLRLRPPVRLLVEDVA